MISGNYYHGTSTHRLESIRKNGFRLGERDDWSKWLCARGVYFVLNRPSVALFFARRAVLTDRGQGIQSEPVVIEVSVNVCETTRMLDLTTEAGMKIFFGKYVTVRSQYGSLDAFLSKNDPCIRSVYSADSFSQVEKDDYVGGLMVARRPYSHFNWDCAVLTQLVDECGYVGVLAVFQEGNPWCFDYFPEDVYEDETTPHFHGIRYRDAVNVCVTHLDLIRGDFTIVTFDDCPEEYIHKVSSTANDRM